MNLFFLRKILILCLYLCAFTAYADCPELDNLPRPDESFITSIGLGEDVERDTKKQVSAFNFTKQQVGISSAAIKTRVISNFSEVFDKLEMNLGDGVELTIPKFPIASFNASTSVTYNKLFNKTKLSQSFVFDYDINLGTFSVSTDPNNPLTDDAKKHLSSACDFKRYYGSSYVCQVQQGANLSVKIDFQFANEKDTLDFNTQISAGISTLSIGGFSLGASLETELNKASKALLKNSRLNITVIQTGGDVAYLGMALGATTAQCSLDNLTACTTILDNVVQYINSTTFTDGVKNLPVTLSYKMCPYSNIPGVPDLPSELTPEINQARKDIQSKYEQLLSDRQRIIDLQIQTLTVMHRQELDALLPKLEKDIETIRNTGKSCIIKLTSCLSSKEQVFANLASYDESIFQLSLADGLVAHYLFEGNAKDVSGNGNDGTPQNVTPAKDRAGKDNGAYQFSKGKITVPHSNKLNLNNNTSTLVAWIKPESLYGYIAVLSKGDWTSQYRLLLDYSDIKVDRWNFVVLSTDSKTKKLYVDGVLKWTKNIDVLESNNTNSLFNIPTQNIDVLENNTYPLYIGFDTFCSGEYCDGTYFNGVIDEIRIYNRVLAETEIKQIYAKDIQGGITSPASLINLSANAKLPIIGGLGMSGSGTLRLMFRGFAIDACVDPMIVLQKYPSGEEVARNDNWQEGGSIAANIQDLPEHLRLQKATDAGILIDLPVGYYTLSLGSKGCNGQGLVGVDLIEAASSSTAKLVNLSANAPVPIIGGLGMSGTGEMTTMFRGFKVDECVDANILIQKYPSGDNFAENDAWQNDSNQAQVQSLPDYLKLQNSTDAGLLRSLTPQYFTAKLTSTTDCQGNGLLGVDMIQ